jgi:hypothetical protein
MSTGRAKNIGAAVLVVLAIVVAVLVFGGNSAKVATTPEVASYSSTPTTATPTPTTAPSTTTTTAPSVIAAGPAVDCPTGAVSTAPGGPIPTAVSAGFQWTPSRYPTTGWCEVAG